MTLSFSFHFQSIGVFLKAETSAIRPVTGTSILAATKAIKDIHAWYWSSIVVVVQSALFVTSSSYIPRQLT